MRGGVFGRSARIEKGRESIEVMIKRFEGAEADDLSSKGWHSLIRKRAPIASNGKGSDRGNGKGKVNGSRQ